MTHTDSRGLPLSTASADAAAQYRHGIDLLLSAWPGVDAAFAAAIAEDPGFALAHAARARAQAMRGEAAAARAGIGQARALVAAHGTERERSHVGILGTVIEGRAAEALRLTLGHVAQWPRDAVIFGLPLGAFGLFAFSGMADHDRARVELCARHAGDFAADDWWFLGYRGWALTEAGDLPRGKAMTAAAHALRPSNANAVHALAHALFEEGAGAEAAAFLADWLPGYDRRGTLHGHISWHRAIIALEAGDADQALALFTGAVRPGASQALALNILTDTVSFLWRLRAYGQAVPPGLWAEAAAFAEPLYRKAGQPFADVHMAMLAAATGDHAAVEQRVAELTALLEAGTLAAGPVVPAICRAALAFAEADDAACIRLLEPVLAEVVRIGGSGAQREVVEDTLLCALMRHGEAAKARALLDRRLHRRPSPRDARWRAALVT